MTNGTPKIDHATAPHRAHRGRLFRKYLLLIITLVSLALLVSGGISLYFAYRQNESALASLQHEKAIGAASRIEQYMRQVSQQLSFAALPQLDAGDVEQRRIEFLKLLRQAPEVTDIAQIDASGREQIAVSRLGMDIVASGRDRSAEPAFVSARRGKPWFGPVYFRKETEPYMTVAIRSGSDQGPLTVAEVNLKFIWDVVSRIKIGDKGKAYVVDGNGLLVADPDIGLVLRKTNLSALAHVKAAAAARSADDPAQLSHDLAGTKVLTSTAAIEPLDWKVFVEQPVSEVYAKLNASIVWTLALLLGGLAVSALAASALARSMVRPIRTLDEGARRIGEGDLEQRIVIETGDELEGLADQFNRMSGQLRESYAGLERKVEVRTAELTESLEYQTAISEVLRVISASTTDVMPVFEAIMESAMRLFGAPIAAVFRYDGRLVHLVGTRGWSADAIDDARRLYPAPPNPHMLSGRIILAGQALTEEDVRADPDYDQTTARVGQWRRMIGAPMLKDGVPLGVVVVAWPDPGPTPQRQADLLKTFADQAVIAIENVRLIDETQQALERQTATAQVLRAISNSPTDVQPVLDTVAERSGLLCHADGGRIWLLEGDHLRAMTSYGGSYAVERDAALLPLRRASIGGRAFIDRRCVHVDDVLPLIDTEYPDVRELQRLHGFRTVLAVPMLREGASIGVIALLRNEVRPFDQAEIDLVQTFADQAVIAIENVRLFRETRDALERQTATAEVLQVISGSVADAQPVFDAIVRSCQRLFDGKAAALLLPDGAMVEVKAFASDGTDMGAGARLQPWPLDRDSATGACILESRVISIADLDEGATRFPRLLELAEQLGYRSGLFVPLMGDGGAIGCIAIGSAAASGFGEKEISLARTFADQAVIAIQNARLFNETREALEQQTASAEVLQVISSSVADPQPVFEKILESCHRLFECTDSTITIVGDDGRLLLGSSRGATAANLERFFPMPFKGSATQLAIKERRVLNYRNVLSDPDVPPVLREVSERIGGGPRSQALAPMLWEGRGVGALNITRRPASGFSEKEIGLLKTFADQAVIAIQNSRLFNETKEALEQQTATAEVLQVISSSVSDSRPVFERILESAERLFASTRAAIFLAPGDGLLHLAAMHSTDRAAADARYPRPLDQTAGPMVIAARRQVCIADVLNSPDVPPSLRQAGADHGNFSIAMTPMLWKGEGVGMITVSREPNVAFNDKELSLLRTFADQAVIAVQNARLFNDTKEALEQQTATAEILRVIGKSVSDTGPVFDKIIDSCQGLFASAQVGIFIVHDDGMVHFGAYRGAALEAVAASFPQPLDETVSGLAIRERRTVHIPDLAQMPDMPAALRRAFDKTGNSSVVWAPMVWEDRGVGSIFVARQPPNPFTDKEITLLSTFADQAVIAIQNSRLFHEIEDKSRQLEMANKHKSEFLANMSHELRTPLNAIIGFSEVLSEQMFGEVNDKQLEYLQDIHSSGHHLLGLINDILDLSKIEAGRMELDLTCFHVPLLLDNSATLVRERASRHGLALALEVEDGLAEWVADERKLKQVVINLLSNAVKFTPAGGRITLRARRVEAGLEIAVIDTGIGIAPDQQALVFEEFRQAGGDYLRKSEGTGLGLSLARRFVELHGGSIHVESTPGQGSTFAFTLPERALEAP